MEELTKEQRESIRVVTGDGAKWITSCVEKYLPNCIRCVDAFHVVEWAMKALDNVRRQSWHEAKSVAESYGSDGKAIPKAADEEYAAASRRQAAISGYQGSAYALGKAPENLLRRRKPNWK